MPFPEFAKLGVDTLMSRHCVPKALLSAAVCLGAISGVAQDTFERAPILYSTADADSPVSRLQTRINEGDSSLDHDEQHGYLRMLLDELEVPVSSQVLVFSKTSFQPTRISPRTPRAIYFNDDVYVGWVRNSDTLELSTADTNLGTTFYTLSRRSGEPILRRETHQCLQCHASSQTNQIPGHIVRSVFPDPDGNPIYRAGTFRTDQTSPFEERWGGWYVSGTHGDQRHMGNVVVQAPDESETLDVEAGANLCDLSTKFDTEPYLSAHSDLVALMVLEHQTGVHNLITAANFKTRQALHYQAEMNRLFKEPEDHRSDSTKSRIRNACRRLVKSMLFCAETLLTDPVAGTSNFAAEFAARGPHDAQGRSLRQFDLEKRMFKYPCSYLIYSEAFNGLPPVALEEIYRQLHEVLVGKDSDPDFTHLAENDRQAILKILRETKQGLPDYWK